MKQLSKTKTAAVTVAVCVVVLHTLKRDIAKRHVKPTHKTYTHLCMHKCVKKTAQTNTNRFS